MQTCAAEAIRFGTGGWRAIIGDDFTKQNIMRVAQGVCDLMREEQKTDRPVMIGYDRRFLSESAAVWIAEVLCGNGVPVWFMHRSAPTPLVMFTPFNDFLDSILSKLELDTIRRAGMRILFDPMHGSGTYPLMTVLYTARCTVDLMNSNKDAYFGGGMPAPGYRQLGTLVQRVSREGYDLGIAVDGDGDRLGIIDPDGTYISANQILVMLYYYLHEYRGWKGPVVRNLATTHMLDRVAESFGEHCYEVPVGFKYISSKMDEVDAVLGGESSGGLTVRGHIYGKDSIYAASLFVEMVCAIGKPPHEIWQELTDRYGVFVMAEDNFRFAPEDRQRVERLLMQEKRLPAFAGKQIAKVGYADGCKVYFDDGSFVICRFSGTEPLLRIFAEDASAESAKALIAEMKAFIQ